MRLPCPDDVGTARAVGSSTRPPGAGCDDVEPSFEPVPAPPADPAFASPELWSTVSHEPPPPPADDRSAPAPADEPAAAPADRDLSGPTLWALARAAPGPK